MPESNLLKLAKQGDAKALAIMLNRSLQPKGITAKVGRKDDYLKILLESAQIPDQEVSVSFIRNGLIKLEVESIKKVKVYGCQTGEDSPAWSQKFELVSQPEKPSITEQPDFNNLLAHQTRPVTETPVPPPVETPSSTEQTPVHNLRQSSTTSTSRSSRQPIGLLSVGNVVSASLRLYREHFKLYYGLAFTAYLWIILPIYGWAKFYAISALISRLAFSELTEQPETVTEARRHVNRRMWSFLWAAILVFVMLLAVTFGAGIIFGILGAAIGAIIGSYAGAWVILALLGAIAFIAFIVGYIRLLSRLYIVEVPLAIENNLGASSTISRSWQLTKGYVSRLQWIVFVAFLITIPVSVVVQIVTSYFNGRISCGFSYICLAEVLSNCSVDLCQRCAFDTILASD